MYCKVHASLRSFHIKNSSSVAALLLLLVHLACFVFCLAWRSDFLRRSLSAFRADDLCPTPISIDAGTNDWTTRNRALLAFTHAARVGFVQNNPTRRTVCLQSTCSKGAVDGPDSKSAATTQCTQQVFHQFSEKATSHDDGRQFFTNSITYIFIVKMSKAQLLQQAFVPKTSSLLLKSACHASLVMSMASLVMLMS